MRKRIFMTMSVLVVAISLMAWDVYENNQREALAKAEAEKIYSLSDITKDVDFSVEKEGIRIDMFDGNIEDFETTIVKDEELQKQINNEMKNLQFQKSDNVYMASEADYRVELTANERFSLLVHKQENEIYFPQGEAQFYRVINSDKFFDALDNALKK